MIILIKWNESIFVYRMAVTRRRVITVDVSWTLCISNHQPLTSKPPDILALYEEIPSLTGGSPHRGTKCRMRFHVMRSPCARRRSMCLWYRWVIISGRFYGGNYLSCKHHLDNILSNFWNIKPRCASNLFIYILYDYSTLTLNPHGDGLIFPNGSHP